MPKKRNRKPGDGTKARKKRNDLEALPPRTAHYDKKKRKQVSGATKVGETSTENIYQWTEDNGGDKVQVKKRSYKKEEAKARWEYGTDSVTGEDSWVSSCGNHCKINKHKFDPNYDEIFGKRNKGASTGKYKKFKKKYD